MCCERFVEGLRAQAFTPILFNIYVLREKAPKHRHLPRSSSTSMSCERLIESLRAQVLTPILFNIYVRRGVGCSGSAGFGSTPVSHMHMQCSTVAVVLQLMPAVLLCGVQSFGAGTIAVLHSILDFPTRPPGSSKTQSFTPIFFNIYESMCCERFIEGLRAQAFTPILFNIYVLPEIQRRPQNTSVYPDLVQHLCAARDSEKVPKRKRLPRSPRSSSTSMCCERFKEGLRAAARD